MYISLANNGTLDMNNCCVIQRIESRFREFLPNFCRMFDEIKFKYFLKIFVYLLVRIIR